ncbi:DNA-3-methyladenine glycosylase [Chlamydia abortus]|uniref:Putative 3-methyladenine DNA glycosylase n=1 Tax=Chlamydia abortus (strain DSM 27085 / S26/3) TaxID=218497 RepID=3MGH_CHLAB|nr:DNA-3-methyladenine glycosylase [Chlamydia abortus]Q5L6N0.1 RecName: Full=Putative 3-methyladenine DNA glycosylase [Chlamydia abortus S26/3]ASD30419.1 DNA-3-methyladenine glycosylase [Chlamydia abortus]AUS59675.1 DNA-3-methyladenine glycosylase II [Chlamydia abortus]EGK69015.1 putative 3-methyladenine DNA glycosylase [Chlamydia abortus LLG]QEM73615.1 DNA-3-methyladenine glycosylase [Chlamydia abortus]QRR31946.1 DNA-3-methyladenine glycosylase [Chlamydia abortus]
MLPESFFLNDDVLYLAKELLGHVLVTHLEGQRTSGIIIETEAYRGPEDKACHAYNYRKTQRNLPMYSRGGIAYIYRCYGMHSLFNVVTGHQDLPHAVLIRAILPYEGEDIMVLRRQWQNKPKHLLTNGPGKVCQALNLTLEYNTHSLSSPQIHISKKKFSGTITQKPRIGIDYAQEYRDLPWRFLLHIKN